MKMYLLFILVVIAAQSGFGLQNNNRSISDQNATARSNILALQDVEEQSDFPSRQNITGLSKNNETAFADSDDEKEVEEEEESSAAGAEESHPYIPTKQVLKNLSEYVAEQLKNNKNETDEDDGEDTEDISSSEDIPTFSGVKNIRNMSITPDQYQALTGGNYPQGVGNSTSEASNYPAAYSSYASNVLVAGKTPLVANVSTVQKLNEQLTSMKRNVTGLKGNAKLSKPLNDYVILTADSKNRTKKIKIKEGQENQKNYQSVPYSHKLQPQGNVFIPAKTYKNASTQFSNQGKGPTYGPWKTIDVSQALWKPSVNSTTDSKVVSKSTQNRSKDTLKGNNQADLMLKLGKKGIEKKKTKKGTKDSKKDKKHKKGIKGKQKKSKKKKSKSHNSKKTSSKTKAAGKKTKKFKSKNLKKIPQSDYKEGTKAKEDSNQNKNKDSNDDEEKDKESSEKDDNKNKNSTSVGAGKIKLNNKTIEIDQEDKNSQKEDNEKQEKDKQTQEKERGDKDTSGHDKNKEEKGAKLNKENDSSENKESNKNDLSEKNNSNETEKGGKQGKQNGSSKDKENNNNKSNEKDDSNETEKGGKQENQNGDFKIINKNEQQNSTENDGKVKVKQEKTKEKSKDEKAKEMASEGKPTVKPSDPSKQETVDGSELKEEPKRSQDERTKELQKTLSKLRFMNGAPGKVHTGQQFSYISQCGLYTEPQNVSQAQHSWVTKTFQPYFYLYEKPKDYEKCKPSDWMYGKDMRGGVFLNFEVKSLHGSNLTNNAKICEKYCCKEPRCEAWVLRFQEGATNNCPEKSFCCWLKNEVPPIEDYYIESASIAGVVHRKHFRHPPTGMRSAVPLGGLGAGSFEMRADGTFHEWTIENQSPGGSAKLSKSALEKMFLGVRVKHGSDEAKSAVLKTHTVHGFENQSVKSLDYSGAYPVSKFGIELSDDFKDKIGLNMYAFSPFHPRDPIESATPAMSFSLEVTNLSPKEESQVSFMLNIPFGYNEDTVRKGGNYQEAEFSRVVTPGDCQRECAKRADCQSWTTNGPHTCMLKDTIPLHSYDNGVISGIRGDWTVKDGVLNCQRPGFSPQSGDISMKPLQTGSEEMTYLVTDDVQNSWNNFKKFGHVNGNLSHTMKLNKTGLHGSVSVSTSLQPKETKLLSIVFSWYFPNKDIADERVGNFYTNMFKNSYEVAKHFEDDLLGSAMDIYRWHSSVFTPPTVKSNNGNDDEDDEDAPQDNHTSKNCSNRINGVATLPTCLQDILVNSMSFMRTAMWFENGRWRQWEAYDCANLDPVHIDFHRIIPYIIFYPDLVKQIMFSWADHQLANNDNGMIQESLSQGCLEETSREGTAGGRQMTDVNVAFIAQTYLIYSWTNDTEFFNQIYPYAARAMNWLIHRSTKNSGLPHRRPDAYDLFELEKYDHSAYNSIMYLLALRVMQKMARIQNDESSLTDVNRALNRAEQLFDVEMWDEKKGFYHAWFDDEWGSPNWLMSDIFYGQVWSYTLGIGELVDKEKIKRHLKREARRNDSPFGLKVMTKSEEPLEIEDTSIILGDEGTSCKSLENVTKSNSIWMSSSTDWSTLQLHLDMPPETAMEQAIKSLDNYRSILRDQWNFHGITSSSHYGLDGLPWATSHYTLHLVLWHLPLALSGQNYYAPTGKISFNPKYSPPYWLPFYTPSCMGNIEAKEKEKKEKNVEIEYTINVSSGRCQFKELSIAKSKYGSAVDLGEGEFLTWSTPKLSQADRIKSMLELLKKH